MSKSKTITIFGLFIFLLEMYLLNVDQISLNFDFQARNKQDYDQQTGNANI